MRGPASGTDPAPQTAHGGFKGKTRSIAGNVEKAGQNLPPKKVALSALYNLFHAVGEGKKLFEHFFVELLRFQNMF